MGKGEHDVGYSLFKMPLAESLAVEDVNPRWQGGALELVQDLKTVLLGAIEALLIRIPDGKV